MLVMTFNLRFANPQDGPNHWDFRKEMVADLILAHGPALLATQEGVMPQLEYLEARLTGYLPLTGHRQVDPTCQYPTIFYRPEQVATLSSDEFWLSQTPRVHRSQSWDSAFPRMATYGLFQEPGREETFYFINTHLDHMGSKARLHGARMIREFFFNRGRPLILAGDFNEPPDGPVYQELMGPGSSLADTWRLVQPPLAEFPTQHSFDGRPRGSRIDWILVTPPFKVTRAAIITEQRHGRHPSDHFPYEAEVEY
jgi:endonuclease/exonuclease/phosphatase family metal-dependent hydrolase